MTRKHFLYTVLIIPIAATGRMRAAASQINVFKARTCGCCGKWVEHLRANGFDVRVQEVNSTVEYQRKYGVPERLQSCHTALVEGYTIEGHVPAADIQRLLKERPKAKGLAAPGMPAGSPGMEASGSEAYSVLIFDEQGHSSVYQNHPRR